MTEQNAQRGNDGTAQARTQSPSGLSGRVRASDRPEGSRERAGIRDRLANQRTQGLERSERPTRTAPPVAAARQQVAQAEARRSTLGSRLADYRSRRGPSLSDPSTPRSGGFRDGHREGYRPDYRPSYVHARYYDRPDLIRHSYRHTHAYYDDHFRLHYRVVRPYYHYPVYYGFHHHGYYHHVYPYYHRKYVFISLGGYWPDDCYYLRYYWYGYHPYVWYGYYPVAREVTGDSYTYYTYNYYSQSDDGTYTSTVSETPAVDQSTWADVREKLDQQDAKAPAAQTVADTRFEEGVKSFEAADYGAAAEKFEEGMRLSPDDMILPFAYAQALFADGQYDESAIVLRKALSRITPDKEGVFYPRGLYANDDVLYAQIEKLVDKVENAGEDADMQLLLGYHLLGTGETGYAREPLTAASQDPENAQAAQVLLKLADKIEAEAKTDEAKTDEAKTGTEKPSAAPESQPQATAEAGTSAQTQTTTGGAQPSSASGVAPAEKAAEPQSQTVPDPNATEQTVKPSEASPSNEPPQGDAGSSGTVPAPANQASIGSFGFSPGLIRGLGRYLRWDLAVFAGIVLLGWTGVYLQWRLPNRA